MVKKTKWGIVLAVGLMSIAIVGCKSDAGGKNSVGEIVREPSTRTPNSVIGKWYEYDEYDRNHVYVWEFLSDREFISAREESYKKQSEDFIITKEKYRIVGENEIRINSRIGTLEYVDYGLCITYEDGDQLKLYEYRQDALEACDAYYTSDLYMEALADENGCLIRDGVLVRYFTNDDDIVIPNVE